MSFAIVPTVEMEGKAGRVVVNNDPSEIAHWTNRGYNVVPGSQKGSVIGVVTEEDLALEAQTKIDQALEEQKVEQAKANPAPAQTAKKK